MKCHTTDNSTSSTQLPHTFSYIVAILGHNHFESPNIISKILNDVRNICNTPVFYQVILF
jgi:hypothetical protein